MEPDHDPTAVVTGATSGIGAAFARRLATRGHCLLVTGRRRDSLEAQAAAIERDCNVRVEAVIAELADDAAVVGLAERLSTLRRIEVLVNNAGFGLGSQAFHAADFAGQAAMLQVHALATMRLSHAVLPAMVANRHGSLINVASVAAFVPIPRHAMYSASKNFIVTFSEALAVELRGTGVRVQALCPGFTRTDFHARQGMDPARCYRDSGPLKAMTADEVVSASLGCLAHDRVVCVPGWRNRLLTLLPRLVPRRLVYRLLASAQDI